jgi:amino acid transporter
MYANNTDPWNHWPIKTVYLWRWIFYAGVIMIFLALTVNILDSYDSGSKTKQYILQVFSIIGMLAFPLFVFHEMVMPAKAILMAFGVSGLVALLVPITLFFIGSYAMFRKLHGVSYQ